MANGVAAKDVGKVLKETWLATAIPVGAAGVQQPAPTADALAAHGSPPPTRAQAGVRKLLNGLWLAALRGMRQPTPETRPVRSQNLATKPWRGIVACAGRGPRTLAGHLFRPCPGDTAS